MKLGVGDGSILHDVLGLGQSGEAFAAADNPNTLLRVCDSCVKAVDYHLKANIRKVQVKQRAAAQGQKTKGKESSSKGAYMVPTFTLACFLHRTSLQSLYTRIFIYYTYRLILTLLLLFSSLAEETAKESEVSKKRAAREEFLKKRRAVMAAKAKAKAEASAAVAAASE